MQKTTPLFDEYKDYEGVKLIDFGGWLLPVNFRDGIIAEHLAVREDVGIFDVSHMGECTVTGPGALDFLENMVTSRLCGLESGRIAYGMMCYPNGTVVDDLLVYCIAPGNKYFVVMNASNVEKDLNWLREHAPEDIVIEDLSGMTAQVALQGPNAAQVLSGLWPEADSLPTFGFEQDVQVLGERFLISRTGYTGEDGFEIYGPGDSIRKIWNALFDLGVLPCGLGARDSLRMEAKLPLYGHELSDSITPLEANLSVFVDLDKDFIGCEALRKQKEQGIARSLRGFEMVDPGVARNGYDVRLGERRIGYVTSGTKSPSLDKFVGYALIERDTGLKFGDLIQIDIHGKMKNARLVRTPFCKHGRRS